MGAALRQRPDVVYFHGGGQLSVLLALLAHGMFRQVSVTNPPPCAAIPALTLRVAHMPVIMRRYNFLVFPAIPPVRKARASRIRTGTLGSVWHGGRLLSWHRKSPAFLRSSVFDFSAIVILPDSYGVFLCLLVSSFRKYHFSVRDTLFYLCGYCNTIRFSECLSMSFSVLFLSLPD